jgi:hypothetical protein
LFQLSEIPKHRALLQGPEPSDLSALEVVPAHQGCHIIAKNKITRPRKRQTKFLLDLKMKSNVLRTLIHLKLSRKLTELSLKLTTYAILPGGNVMWDVIERSDCDGLQDLSQWISTKTLCSTYVKQSWKSDC